MATLSEVTQFLFDVASADQLVNTIAFTPSDQIDKNKENLYPLFNIDIIDSLFISGISNTRFRITIVTDRDIKPVLHNNKVFNNNLIDNLNECHSIAGRFIGIVKQPNQGEITVEDITTINMLKAAYNNELDGVQFDVLLWHDIGKGNGVPGANDCSIFDPENPGGNPSPVPVLCSGSTVQYVELGASFVQADAFSISYNTRPMTYEELEERWLDNSATGNITPLGGLMTIACDGVIEVGRALYFSNNHLPVDGVFNGRYYASTSGYTGSGEINGNPISYRTAPIRLADINNNNPQNIFSGPVSIVVLDGIITEITALPITGFAFE